MPTIGGSAGVNFNAVKALRAQNEKKISSVKSKVADAKAKAADAEVEQAQAQQDQAAAGQKQAMGGLIAGIGSAMLAAAGALAASGVWAPVAIGLVAAGSVIVLAGAGLQAVAMKEMADATNRGNEALETAVENGTLEDTQAAVLSRAMQTSNTLRMEEAMLEELMQKEQDADPKVLKQAVRDGFEKGAKTIKDGGIATVNGENGENRYFERKDNGDIIEISVKKDENGDPIAGAFGQLEKDEDIGALAQDDPDAVEALSIFSFEDQIRRHIEGGVPLYDDQGNVSEVTDPISRIRVNGDGSVSQEFYNLDNPAHAAELYALVLVAHEEPPPHDYYEKETTDENGNTITELGFETADGNFISLDSLTTEDTRDASLAALGFVPGDPRYEALKEVVDNALESDAASIDPSYYSNLLKNAQQQALNEAPGNSSSFLDGTNSASNAAGDNRDNSNGLGAA